jgi:hypothetical protein
MTAIARLHAPNVSAAERPVIPHPKLAYQEAAPTSSDTTGAVSSVTHVRHS